MIAPYSGSTPEIAVFRFVSSHVGTILRRSVARWKQSGLLCFGSKRVTLWHVGCYRLVVKFNRM